jgi:hypothetical protein
MSERGKAWRELRGLDGRIVEDEAALASASRPFGYRETVTGLLLPLSQP